MCNLNVIVVLEFISRDLYLLFVIRFSSKFQNSVFNQHMRPKSGLKFPRPFHVVTDIVNDNKLGIFRKCVHTRVVITLLLHDVHDPSWKTATSY